MSFGASEPACEALHGSESIPAGRVGSGEPKVDLDDAGILDSDLAIIGMHFVAGAVENALTGAWESYPELGEYDWQAIADRVKAAHPYPDQGAYLAAYRRLEARAEHSNV